ncbi:MAG: hypothetical protein MPN21_09560 [Thermoanaerobaculia bacterium]|nr:hypothetical protein [Thermoanaerobaculia bacterium]
MTKYRFPRVATLAICALVTVVDQPVVYAHQDRVLPLSPAGTVIGIPEEYGPVAVRVIGIGSVTEPKSDPEGVVRIHGTVAELPGCAARLFLHPPDLRIRTTGSWHHDFAILPPYLNVIIPHREYEGSAFDGYSLIFDLRSAALLEIRKWWRGAHGVQESALLTLERVCDEDLFQHQVPGDSEGTSRPGEPQG